jgi:hypothetical protein
MPLPLVSDLPTKTITVRGEKVSIRSLSRAQSLHLNDFQQGAQEEAAELFLLACAFEVTTDEAKVWLESTDPLTVDEVLEEILELSAVREVIRRAKERENEDSPKG